MTIENLKNKKIGILGLGVNNNQLTNWLIKHGIGQSIVICDADVKLKTQNSKLKTTTKNLKLKWRLGENYLKNLTDFDIVFRTPGIPYLTPEIQEAKKSGVIIYSQTKLFFDLCPAKIIGVTGTKGKGTTAALISEILKRNVKCQMSNVKIYLAGNFGKDPFEFLDKLTKNDIVIMELSSFQLQDLAKSPSVAVVTNLTSEHLNHHQSIGEYTLAKVNILKYQKTDDWAILNNDDKAVKQLASKTKAKVLWFGQDDGKAVVSDNQRTLMTICPDDIVLPGRHNLIDAAAAAAAAATFNIQPSTIKLGLKRFRGLPSRLELVYTSKDGVKFFDDSASTIPEATIAAIKSLAGQPIHLIVGGSSKGADFGELGEAIDNSSVKTLILLGRRESLKISRAVRNRAITNLGPPAQAGPFMSLAEALKKIKVYTKPGDIVLLSPAAASFDLFKNYRDRSRKFRQAINEYF